LEHTNVGNGGTEPNYQVATLWSPVPDQSFRASYGVAHTIPNIYNSFADETLTGTLRFIGNPDLTPQRVTSYEVGYRGSCDEKRLQLDTGVFYTRVDSIDQIYLQSISSGPIPVYTFGYSNIEQAIARGIETEVKYRFNHNRSIYLNYTYEHVTDTQDNEGDVTQNTPVHKVNLGGFALLGGGFSGTLNLGYKDSYFIASDGRSTVAPVPAYWRLDLRLGYALSPRVELFLAGQNLATSQHIEFADGLTVPHTYQAGVTVKLGGKE
jgi:outer membrane receptor protein involved in Fe transport